MSNELKQDTVEQLYGLRAGLSVISEYADEVEAQEEKIEDEEDSLSSFQTKLNDLRSAIGTTKKEIQSLEEGIEELEEKKASRVVSDEEKEELRKEARGSVSPPYMPVGLIVGVVLVMIIIFCIVGANINPYLFFLLFVPAGIVGICIAIYFAQYKYNERTIQESFEQKLSEREKTFIQVKENIDKQIAELKTKIEEDQELLVQAYDMEAQANKLLGPEQKKSAAKKKKINGEISALVNKSTAVYNSLKESYGTLIAEADWENTDLLIFYLQSGRADTLKEALQLVDVQRQNDAVVNAILQATNSICKEIEAGINKLGTGITRGLKLLSDQINDNFAVLNRKMNANVEQQREKLSALEKKLDKAEKTTDALVSSEQLTQSMLKKAATSSEKMMQDLNYIKRHI